MHLCCDSRNPSEMCSICTDDQVEALPKLGNCTVGSYSELTASLSSMVRQQIFTSA